MKKDRELAKEKLIKVIKSCQTSEQLQTACNMYKNFIHLYEDDNEIFCNLENKMNEFNID